MADKEKVQGDPEPEPEPEPEPTPEPQPEPEKGKDDKKTPEELRAEIARLQEHTHKLNKENEDRRKKLKKFEADEAARLEASKTDEQRKEDERKSALDRAEKAETALKLKEAEYAIRMQALAMDFHDDDDALRPEVISAVEYDDEGRIIPKSIKDALKKLAEAKPHLVDKSDEADPKKKTNGTPPRGNNPPPKPKTEPEPERPSLVR